MLWPNVPAVLDVWTGLQGRRVPRFASENSAGGFPIKSVLKDVTGGHVKPRKKQAQKCHRDHRHLVLLGQGGQPGKSFYPDSRTVLGDRAR